MTSAEVRSIDASFVQAVYEASRTAERQRRGQVPVPDPPGAAYVLLERVEGRCLGLDPAEILDSLDGPGLEDAAVALEPRRRPANVIDLMGWLEASVARARDRGRYSPA